MKKLYDFVWVLFFGLLFGSNAIAQQYDDPVQQEMISAIDSALAALERHDMSQCAQWIQQAERRSEPNFPQDLLYHFYQTKGKWLSATWQLREAEDAYLRAIALSSALSDSAKLVYSHSGLASTLAEQNRYLEAIRHQKLALSYFGDMDSLNYYGLLSNLAVSYNQAQLFDKSLENYMEVKRFFEKREEFDKLAIVENNIGELYRERLNDLDRAQKQYHRAMALNKKQNNTTHLVQNYHNLGLVHSDLQQYDSAFYYARKSFALRKEMGSQGGLAISWHSLGNLYFDTGQLDSALIAFEKTLILSKEMGIPPGVYYASIGLARVYDEMNAFAQAENYLLDASRVASEVESLEFQSGVQENLYDLYKRNGHYDKALAAHESYHTLQDSIQGTQNAHNLAEIKTKYETDLAAAENETLRSQKALQSSKIARQRWLMIFLGLLLFTFLVAGAILAWSHRQRKIAFRAVVKAKHELQDQYDIVKEHEVRLHEVNALKDQIFAVLGHDLRSPLINISSMLELISADEITREELGSIMSHLKRDTDMSINTLHSILQWSRLQMSQQAVLKENIKVAGIFNDLKQIFESSARVKNISLKFEDDSEGSLWADEYQFRSIATNLISNAIKFSPEGETVEVQVTDNSESIVFSVSDRGKGMDPALIRNMKDRNPNMSVAGTKGEKGTGIGLQIVKDFVEAHQGRIEAHRNTHGGAIVKVYLPKSSEAGGDENRSHRRQSA